MKKLLLGLLLFTSTVFGDSTPFIEFKGGIDVITPDKQSETFSTFDGIKNVRTDDLSQIIKCRGTVKDNTTALTGSLGGRSAYVYNQADGDSYKIVESSNSVFYSKGDTNYTAIITTISSSYVHDYTTINDNLYGTNGYDSVWYWDGSNLYESTNTPKGKYIEAWRQRNWVAGVSGNASRLYYSTALDPESYPALNFIDIATNDGDYITGLLVSGNDMYVTKTRKTYKIVEYESGAFTYVQISNEIGCLYNSTMVNFQNYPTWLSDRGIEQYTNKFNLLSYPIDNFVKDLRQLTADSSLVTLTTAEDWGEGSGVNIDTTTTSGSVEIENYNHATGESESGSNIGTNTPGVYYRQAFNVPYEIIVSTVEIYAAVSGTAYYDTDAFAIVTSTDGVLATELVGGNVGTLTTSVDFTSYNITLSSGTTYYFRISDNAHFSNARNTFRTTSTNTNTTSYVTLDWVPVDGRYLFYELNGCKPSASYTSAISTATSWGSWGNFQVTESEPSGSTITHYVKTSTATDNFSTKSLITVTNGNPISSTEGPYIQYFASFTRTTSTAEPQIDDVTFNYYGTSIYVPQVISYDNCLYVAVSTNTDTQRNNMVLVYQKDQSWTKYTLDVAGWMFFRGNLWYVSALDSGQVYQAEVDDTYTFDGSSYESMWTSKYVWANPYQRMFYKDLFLVGENNDSSEVSLGYRYDGADSDFTYHDISLDDDYQVTKKLALPILNSRSVQFRIKNDDAYVFKVNRLYLTYGNAGILE